MSGYSQQVLITMAKILDENPDTDFYILRGPESPIPPLFQPNAVHRVMSGVQKDALFIIDVDTFPVPEEQE